VPPSAARLLLALAAAAGAGAIHALVFPPWNLGALAWVALVPVLALLRAEEQPWRGALLGAAFGAASVVAMAPWLYELLTGGFDLSRRVAAALAAGVLGFYALPFAAFGALAVRLRRGWLPAALAPALGWSVAEALRAHGPEGLPWLLYGHSQHESPAVLQLAWLGGVPAISFVLVAVNGLLVEAGFRARGARDRRRSALGHAAAALAVVGTVAGLAHARLALAGESRAGEPVAVGLVQAAIPQERRWRADRRETNLERQLALTRRAVAQGARLVVWSETALDFPLREMPDLPERLAQALGPDTLLLAGAPRWLGEERYANSAVLFDARGRRLAAYDKVRLVPFVERGLPAWLEVLPARLQHPIRSRLEGFVAEDPYVAGGGFAPLPAAGLEAGVLICFEAIDPELARAAVRAGAELLVNLSNDAFFPSRGAAQQHAAMATFRAVETGRPLVRVANRGPGMVVEPAGRIRVRLGPDEPEVQVALVAPQRGSTPFLAGGWALPWAFGALALAGLLPGCTGAPGSGRAAARPDRAA